MATSPGWATLGNTIAGGNKLNSALAYDQGESLGAKTADALAQARARIDQNNANDNLDANLKPLIPDDATRAAIVQGHRAGLPPEQIFNSLKTNQETGFNAKIADPTTPDDQTARYLFANGKPANIISSEGEGQITNRLHPSAGVSLTPIGTAIAGQKAAQTAEQTSAAAKNQDQIAHPEKYRLLPGPQTPGNDGSKPVDQETYAQLVAQGLAPMPTAGRALLQMGGEDFTRRVNYLAGKQNAPPAAAANAGTTPPVAAPGGAAPAAPAAAPFQANFNANQFGVNRTTANDFARSTGTGGKLDSVNRIAGHLDVLQNLYDNLGNKDFVPTNQLVNLFKQSTGKQYPGSAQLAAQMVGTEIVKSMTNVGAGGVDERQNLATAFGPNGTPEGQKTAIKTANDLVAEQARDLAMRGARGGLKGIYTPGQYFSPRAVERYGLTDPNATTPAAPTSAAPSLPSADAITAELARRGIK